MGSGREFFSIELHHQLYAGDTPLHLAAAAHDPMTVRELLAAGADVSARNRRGAQPLHYAVDGGPGSPRWNPDAQRATITALLAAGADPNTMDKNGSSPLHRAIRNRCADAVRALLDGGADPLRPNAAGSTPLQLARWTTGKSGSGSPKARSERARILAMLDDSGTSSARRHG
jgi:ankyrin repeat protein